MKIKKQKAKISLDIYFYLLCGVPWYNKTLAYANAICFSIIQFPNDLKKNNLAILQFIKKSGHEKIVFRSCNLTALLVMFLLKLIANYPHTENANLLKTWDNQEHQEHGKFHMGNTL